MSENQLTGDKPIIPSWQMSTDEYIEQMKKSQAQLGYCRLFGFRDLPKDYECYHGNSINLCPSLNCQIDSGRMTSKVAGVANLKD